VVTAMMTAAATMPTTVATTKMFTMMTAAVATTKVLTMMTAAVATTKMFTVMTATVATTKMFAMMTATVAMTEMFTMMAAMTDQKPAGKAIVRIVASVVRIVASVVRIVASVVRIVASVVRIVASIRIVASVIRIVASVVRIVGVVTVISAPARKQGGHQQSRQNPSPGNLSPPAPDRFQLGKTSYLFKLGAGSKVVYLLGRFRHRPFFCRRQEDEKTRLDVR
jgi:hypothetical protein